MYYIGIDVHSKKCMTTIKGRTKDILKQTEFDTTSRDRRIHQDDPPGRIRAGHGRLRIHRELLDRPHDMLEEAGINTLLAHPHNTKIITQAVYKNDRATRRSWPTCAGWTWFRSRSWRTRHSGICAS